MKRRWQLVFNSGIYYNVPFWVHESTGKKTQFNLLCFCMFGFFVPVTHMETSNPLSVVFDYICYVLKSTFVYLIKKGNKKLLQQVQIQNLLFLFENGHYHLGRGRGCSIENGCNSTSIWKWKTVMINN